LDPKVFVSLTAVVSRYRRKHWRLVSNIQMEVMYSVTNE
jgi:hypothetical protein